jgi:hypothetical protein
MLLELLVVAAASSSCGFLAGVVAGSGLRSNNSSGQSHRAPREVKVAPVPTKASPAPARASSLTPRAPAPSLAPASPTAPQVAGALLSLGFSKREAEAAISKSRCLPGAPVGDQVKAALAVLAK